MGYSVGSWPARRAANAHVALRLGAGSEPSLPGRWEKRSGPWLDKIASIFLA